MPEETHRLVYDLRFGGRTSAEREHEPAQEAEGHSSPIAEEAYPIRELVEAV